MNTKRYGHCSNYLQGHLYVMGGFNHDDIMGSEPVTLKRCEKINLKKMRIIKDYNYKDWEGIQDMMTPRAYFAACSLNDKVLYVFGGLTGYETINLIEEYMPELDRWT